MSNLFKLLLLTLFVNLHTAENKLSPDSYSKGLTGMYSKESLENLFYDGIKDLPKPIKVLATYHYNKCKLAITSLFQVLSLLDYIYKKNEAYLENQKLKKPMNLAIIHELDEDKENELIACK